MYSVNLSTSNLEHVKVGVRPRKHRKSNRDARLDVDDVEPRRHGRRARARIRTADARTRARSRGRRPVLHAHAVRGEIASPVGESCEIRVDERLKLIARRALGGRKYRLPAVAGRRSKTLRAYAD